MCEYDTAFEWRGSINAGTIVGVILAIYLMLMGVNSGFFKTKPCLWALIFMVCSSLQLLNPLWANTNDDPQLVDAEKKIHYIILQYCQHDSVYFEYE